jgi:hypothetical protein
MYDVDAKEFFVVVPSFLIGMIFEPDPHVSPSGYDI